MLMPDFDTYPNAQLRLLTFILLALRSDIKMAKLAFIWLIYGNILLRMTQPMQLGEALLDPVHVPEGFHIRAAQLADDGFVNVTWSHKLTPSDTGQARYYSGLQTGLMGMLIWS